MDTRFRDSVMRPSSVLQSETKRREPYLEDTMVVPPRSRHPGNPRTGRDLTLQKGDTHVLPTSFPRELEKDISCLQIRVVKSQPPMLFSTTAQKGLLWKITLGFHFPWGQRTGEDRYHFEGSSTWLHHLLRHYHKSRSRCLRITRLDLNHIKEFIVEENQIRESSSKSLNKN